MTNVRVEISALKDDINWVLAIDVIPTHKGNVDKLMESATAALTAAAASLVYGEQAY